MGSRLEALAEDLCQQIILPIINSDVLYVAELKQSRDSSILIVEADKGSDDDLYKKSKGKDTEKGLHRCLTYLFFLETDC